jgi:hypothetical protein
VGADHIESHKHREGTNRCQEIQARSEDQTDRQIGRQTGAKQVIRMADRQVAGTPAHRRMPVGRGTRYLEWL